MIKNHYLHKAILPFLIGYMPSAFAYPQLQNEAKIINNTNIKFLNLEEINNFLVFSVIIDNIFLFI